MKNKSLRACLSFLLIAILAIPLPVFADEYGAIEIDGYYDDWEDKPHTDVYNGNNPQSWKIHHVALFRDDTNLYVHINFAEINNQTIDGLKITLNTEYGSETYELFPDYYWNDSLENNSLVEEFFEDSSELQEIMTQDDDSDNEAESSTTRDDQTQAPEDDQTQALEDDQTQTPEDGQTQTTRDDQTQNPEEDRTQTTKDDQTQNPEEDQTQTTRDDQTQNPEEDQTQTTRDDQTQSPEEDQIQTTREDQTQSPEEDQTQTTRDDQTQSSEDNQTQTTAAEAFSRETGEATLQYNAKGGNGNTNQHTVIWPMEVYQKQGGWISVGSGYFTLSEDSYDAEFLIPLSTITDQIDQLTDISMKIPKLGKQWIYCYGTSTGPYIAAAIGGLLVFTSAGYITYRRRRLSHFE